MSAIETRQGSDDNKVRKGGAAAALGETIANAEEKAIDFATRRVYRFRLHHPYLYGLAAFIVGGAVISIFTMTTYTNWAFEGVNLTTAVYQTLFGGLGGGVASAILAFGYAANVKGTRAPAKSAAVNRIPKQNFVA